MKLPVVLLLALSLVCLGTHSSADKPQEEEENPSLIPPEEPEMPGQAAPGESIPVYGRPTTYFHVGLRRNNVHFCSGALIHFRLVLTAAHCVAGGEGMIQVHWNTNDRTTDRDEIVDVSRAFIHPEYSAKNARNDIALLYLATPIRETRPWPIATAPSPSGSRAMHSGWSWFSSTSTSSTRPRILRRIALQTIGRAECERAMSGSGLTIGDTHLCTSLPSGKGAFCQGESGGPLVGNGGYLIGILVTSSGVCGTGRANVFTDTHPYLPWVVKTYNDYIRCPYPTSGTNFCTSPTVSPGHPGWPGFPD